jgi:long-chain fatty acid transport protein
MHQLGFQYRSRTNVDYEGTVNAAGLTGTLAAIFGGTSYSTKTTWDISLPQSAVVGYSFRPNDKWTINFDAEWTDWSSIEQEDVSFPEEGIALRVSTLNSLADLNLDCESSWAYSIGTEYSLNEKIRLRTGYFFHETPIPDANFNTFLPDADSHGVNLGAGYSLNDAMGVDLAWSGVFFQDRDLASTTHDSAASSVRGNYEEFINSVMLTFNWKFGK